MKSCYLYHICHEKDKYNLQKGYIGISDNPAYRWMRHKKYEKKNGHLQKAYRKYTDIIEYIVLQGSREYCLYLETQLRPEKGIGWNMEKGGGDPPNLRGKVISQSQKDKIGRAQSGIKSSKWKGWWIVDGIIYNTTIEVSAFFNVTTKTVCNRCKNPKFSNWIFKPAERKGNK